MGVFQKRYFSSAGSKGYLSFGVAVSFGVHTTIYIGVDILQLPPWAVVLLVHPNLASAIPSPRKMPQIPRSGLLLKLGWECAYLNSRKLRFRKKRRRCIISRACASKLHSRSSLPRLFFYYAKCAESVTRSACQVVNAGGYSL